MPSGFKIRGIAPYELRNYPDSVKLMFWGWVTELGLKAKDRDLARGLDAVGEPLRPILPATRRNRRSEMTPSGKGDPSAPPLMPGRKLSRTRSLLAGRAFTTHAEFYWRYDAWTGDTWAVILTYHKRMGRDVFGLSDDSLDLVRRQCLAKWQKWKREGGMVPTAPAGKRVLGPAPGVAPRFEPAGKLDMTYATLGINVPADLTGRRGGMTEAELKAYYRGTAAAEVQGRPSAGYNRLLAHVWGQGPQGPTAGGAVVPIPPTRPRPAVPAVPAAGPTSPRPQLPPAANVPLHPNPEIARALRAAADAGIRAGVVDHPEMIAKMFRVPLETIGNVPAGYFPDADMIVLNARAMAWSDPAWLARSKSTGWLATGHADQVIRHEMGHYYHRHNRGLEQYKTYMEAPVPRALRDQIGAEISRYATTNVQEFVAETYAALLDGREISAVILEYYDLVGGIRP